MAHIFNGNNFRNDDRIRRRNGDEMNEDKALKVIDVQALESSGDPAVQIQAFEARQRVLRHALTTGLKSTNARDWTNLGGNPYLQGSGAEKMLPCLPGLQITNVDETCQEHEDAKGRYYTYITKGTCTFYTTSIEVIGRASSRDSFFFKAKDRERDLEEINRNDIAGSAYTDMIRNGIVRLFGLRNLTWEDLERYGIKKGSVAAVNYSKDKQQENKASQGSRPDNPFWKWEGKDGGQLISAKTGDHFSEAFLLGCGMKKGAKGIFTSKYSDALFKTLQAGEKKPENQTKPEPGTDEYLNDVFPPEGS